jgi:hypothetical protein
MKTYTIALLAAVAAASAPTNGTTLTMQSTTNSKIKMGNAVFAGYCQGDVAPTFNGIDLDAARLHPDGVSLVPGSDHTITLTLLNVKASCLGNNGVAPCADDAGQARAIDTQFVCKFHSPSFLSSYLAQGDDASSPVQAVRSTETYAGEQYVSTEVTCVLPRRANIEHDIVVSLEYHGKQVVQLPYVGRQGGDTIPIGATETPTQYPTAVPTMAPTAPTAFPTAAPTKAPTAPTATPTKAPTKPPTASVSSLAEAGADWVQMGTTMVGEAGNTLPKVHLSADGQTMACSEYEGSLVRIFTWESGSTSWVQRGADIHGEDAGDMAGFGLDLSADGQTVVIGARGNDNGAGANAGHVRVYVWDSSQWVQRGADIDGEGASDHSGLSVSMSADGQTVAIGAPYNDNDVGANAGHVRVYVWGSSQWVQRGADIDGEAVGDGSGDVISLSADGQTIAIGAYHNNDGASWSNHGVWNKGHVRIYTWDTSNWVQLGADIDGEVLGDDASRNAVSLSADGRTVAIGALKNDGAGTSAGHVRIFTWGASSWVQLGADIDGERAGDVSGWSVSISADGRTVAIAAPMNDPGQTGHRHFHHGHPRCSDQAGLPTKACPGHVRIFTWGSSSWVQVGTDIDGEAGDSLGQYGSLSLSADGLTMAVGGGRHRAQPEPIVRVYRLQQ